MKYVDSIHDCMGLADEKIRLIKANIAVGRLRGPEKASHAQGLHKKMCSRKI